MNDHGLGGAFRWRWARVLIPGSSSYLFRCLCGCLGLSRCGVLGLGELGAWHIGGLYVLL